MTAHGRLQNTGQASNLRIIRLVTKLLAREDWPQDID